MSVFCQAVVYLLAALPAVAQPPAFATIAIKPAGSADPRDARVQVLPNGDLIASAVPMIRLLTYAYDLPANPSPRLSVLFPTGPFVRSMISKRKRPPTPSLPVFWRAKYEAEFSK
jgi:hypothetical protein